MDTSPDNRSHGAPVWTETPLAQLLLAQAAGATATFAATCALSAGTGVQVPLFWVLATGGLLAAWIGGRLRLAYWWIPVQINLAPAAALVSMLAVPPWFFLTAFGLLGLVYWNAARGRVPFYLTNRTTFAAIAELIPVGPGHRFLDVGHGIGGILLYLSVQRPDLQLTGIESAPLPFLVSLLQSRPGKYPNLAIRYGDFWNLDFAEFDVIYAFLSPAPMPALYEKVRREMKPGALFISNSFTVPEAAPDVTLTLGDRRRTRLHIWKMP